MESKLKHQCQDSVGELPNLFLREGGYPHLPTTPIKQDAELTDWISGDLKPVRDGVYERKYPGEPESVYNKFANGKWHVGGWTIEQADFKSGISEYQNDPWRGLTQNPEVQP